MLHDLRAALRALRARPGFAAIIVLTLTLAIGGNTAVFSVVHAVLPARPPDADPDRLVTVAVLRSDGDQETLSIPDFRDYQAAGGGLRWAAYAEAGINLTGGGDPERLRWARASEGFFPLLGAR